MKLTQVLESNIIDFAQYKKPVSLYVRLQYEEEGDGFETDLFDFKPSPLGKRTTRDDGIQRVYNFLDLNWDVTQTTSLADRGPQWSKRDLRYFYKLADEFISKVPENGKVYLIASDNDIQLTYVP